MTTTDEGTKGTPGAGRPAWRWLGLTALLTAAIAVGVTALLVNIFERKQEGRDTFFRVVELTDETVDPAEWGKNFPIQYDSYKRTVDQQRTRYGGSEAVPRQPTAADPRSVVAQSRLDEDPRLRTMWAGYAFSKDFREERGHAYMLDDQTYTERQQVVKQPGTCIHCHGSVYVPYKKLGGGDLIKGFEMMNKMPFTEARKLQRQAQFLLDFVEAENSVGFHAPEEAERLLAISIDYSRQGQIALLRGGAPVPPVVQAPAGMVSASH